MLDAGEAGPYSGRAPGRVGKALSRRGGAGMGKLRIIGGDRKGLPLSSLRGSSLRPTSGRVREALFDILGGDIAGARFLDLFAGTGAVGIEALSRKAALCIFVEKDRAAAAIVRRNLLSGGFGPRGGVIVGSLPAALARLPRGESFDLVFVDPPYGSPQGEETLQALGRSGCLAPACRVILEHRKSWEPPARSGCLGLRRRARYGDTTLSFFVKDDGEAAEGSVRGV